MYNLQITLVYFLFPKICSDGPIISFFPRNKVLIRASHFVRSDISHFRRNNDWRRMEAQMRRRNDSKLLKVKPEEPPTMSLFGPPIKVIFTIYKVK